MRNTARKQFLALALVLAMLAGLSVRARRLRLLRHFRREEGL